MILERITVAGFRTFAEPVTLSPDRRFTVIYAPNGTGKSTLLDALYYGLLERHSITGDGAKQRFKSLGRELTPTIEIDFAVDDQRYRLRKLFLASAKSASLQRFEAGRYVALADGVPADDFVRDLFCAVPPGRGVLEANRHLGFHHVLFSPGRASFADLPESVSDKIRSMLGGSALAVSDGERKVQELASKRYQHYFTNEGSFKTAAASANIPALEEKHRLAQQAELEARQQYARLEKLNVDYTDREAEAGRMSATRDRIRGEVAALKLDVDEYNKLKAAGERAARAEAEARIPYERIGATIRQVSALRAEGAALVQPRTECSRELGRLAAAAATMLECYNGARTTVENAGAALGAVQRRAGDVTAAETYAHAREDVERLKSILAAYEQAAAELAEVAAAQSTIVAPNRAELDALRNATSEYDALQRTIAASALSLEIDAETAITIEVIAGERAGPLVLSPGSTTVVAAAQEFVVVDVPGLGRIRARGTDGAAKARKSLRPLAAKLEAANERYGKLSIPDLGARTERAEELRRAYGQAQKAMRDALGGRAIEEVRASLGEARIHIDAIETMHQTWRTKQPDAAGQRAAFDRDFQVATDRLRNAQIELRAAEQPKGAIEARILAQRTLETELSVKLETNALQREALESDGRDDATRAEHEQSLALIWNAARAELIRVTSSLARFREDPRVALDGLQTAEREAGAAYEEALGDAKTCRAQLDMQANLGSYAKLAAAEELVSQCESDVATAQAHAAASACLSAAFEQVRTERVAAIAAPITAASTRYLTRIVGSPIGTIAIGDGLAPGGLIEAVSGIRLAIDGTLSAGEQEQIYLATRLALADVISKDRGRQLFVVDDAVTATDPNRLRRFIGILEELSRERLQIIVTTADRSRYLGIIGAKHFDLAAAIVGQ